jgi:hypothetical protein
LRSAGFDVLTQSRDLKTRHCKPVKTGLRLTPWPGFFSVWKLAFPDETGFMQRSEYYYFRSYWRTDYMGWRPIWLDFRLCGAISRCLCSGHPPIQNEALSGSVVTLYYGFGESPTPGRGK